MKKVLMLAPNYYTSPFQVGSHHYARTFEKLGYEVAYISSPISILHSLFANNDDYAKRESIYNSNGIQKKSIWYYVPKAYVVPQNSFVLSSSFVMNHWYKYAKIKLLQVLKEKGFDSVDILWFDSPIYHFLLDEIKYKKSILRLADYSKGLGTSDIHFNKEVEIGNRVDKVIYTSKSIFKYYQNIKDKSKMYYISNGIDLSMFDDCTNILPSEFKNIPSPRVIYIGAIDKWFDIGLVYDSAISYPEYSFILIGKSCIDLDKLEKLDNIYILGIKQHETICNYLNNSDIGIIPFKQTTFVNSINPLKIYEYLASGLHVVSMKWKELEPMNSYCILTDTRKEFIANLHKYKDINKKDLKNFLENNSWDQKLKSILENNEINI